MVQINQCQVKNGAYEPIVEKRELTVQAISFLRGLIEPKDNPQRLRGGLLRLLTVVR